MDLTETQYSGIPKNIGELLFEDWHIQKRYVRFDGNVCPEVLEVTSVHPQGGSWGPTVCQL